MSIQYLDPALVVDKKQTQFLPARSMTGYGSKLPSQWLLKLKGPKGTRWHRVYVIQYSNAGSAYIISKGQMLFLGSFEPRYWKKTT